MSKRKKFRHYSSILWLIVITPIFVVFGLFYFASVGGFGEMPELEDVETTFSEDELEYDRAALNVQYSIRHHTPAYNLDNMYNMMYR